MKDQINLLHEYLLSNKKNIKPEKIFDFYYHLLNLTTFSDNGQKTAIKFLEYSFYNLKHICELNMPNDNEIYINDVHEYFLLSVYFINKLKACNLLDSFNVNCSIGAFSVLDRELLSYVNDFKVTCYNYGKNFFIVKLIIHIMELDQFSNDNNIQKFLSLRNTLQISKDNNSYFQCVSYPINLASIKKSSIEKYLNHINIAANKYGLSHDIFIKIYEEFLKLAYYKKINLNNVPDYINCIISLQ